MTDAEPQRSRVEQRAYDVLRKALDSPTFRPPMLPVVAQKALELLRDPMVSAPSLAHLIERDQVLAVRFLSVANSAFYRRAIPTLSVTQAIARMGLVAARDLLYFTSLEPFFFDSKTFAADMQRLREHSLATSASCRYLARMKSMSVDDASLAGLVHDIGAASLLKYIADHEKEFAPVMAVEGALQRLMQELHPVAGERISGGASPLPPLVADVISGHHAAEPTSSRLLKLVAAGDELAEHCGVGSGIEFAPKGALLLLVGDPLLVDKNVLRFREELETGV